MRQLVGPLVGVHKQAMLHGWGRGNFGDGDMRGTFNEHVALVKEVVPGGGGCGCLMWGRGGDRCVGFWGWRG